MAKLEQKEICCDNNVHEMWKDHIKKSSMTNSKEYADPVTHLLVFKKL